MVFAKNVEHCKWVLSGLVVNIFIKLATNAISGTLMLDS